MARGLVRVLVEKCLYCGSKRLEAVTYRVDHKNILECGNCGLLMVDSLEANTSAMYTGEYFQKDSDTKQGYTNYFKNSAANMIGKYAFARIFGVDKGSHLDLGCADGSMMELFLEDKFETKGIDISADAVEIANQKGLTAVRGELTSLPKDYGNNDYVTAFDVFEHVSNPKGAFEFTKEALSKDGMLVFSTLAIDKFVPTEFWFNNSLEHYIYFTKKNLSRILGDVFGENGYHFIELEINGVREFWGIASKNGINITDKTNLDILASFKVEHNFKNKGSFVSLFYSQSSHFNEASEFIEKWGGKWPQNDRVKATFFNLFLEGKLELAVQKADDGDFSLPLNESAFWQALSAARKQLSDIQKTTIRQESEAEILDLRGQLFKTRDELHALRNSRIVGRLIRARDRFGHNVPEIRHLPMRTIRVVKVRTARHLPAWFRRPFMRVVRRVVKGPAPKSKYIQNKKWHDDKPLVSVIVPYYNRADVIDDTLYSLTQQTLTDFEIIIVDDGSKDKASIKKLNRLEKDGYPATFIRQKNGGVANARNNGIRAAQGKYIVCLDSDDILDPTYLEKTAAVLETNPDASVATTYMEVFGVLSEKFTHTQYDPLGLYDNNMVITAAMFKKHAWEVSGGYKSGIGYEDWEFWLNLAENGFWAIQIPEYLFRYRTSMQSRYIEDKDLHWKNLKLIRTLHNNYKTKVKTLLRKRQQVHHISTVETAMTNLFRKSASIVPAKKNILITIPWMTFGGAETLIYNFCREIKDDYNITFVTGLVSENEWEYKFKEISKSIYHLPNLFVEEALYLEYISHQISQKHIDILHIIHNGFTFDMLESLKLRHPKLRVILTLFNDRAAYFNQSLDFEPFIDTYTSDNVAVIKHYEDMLKNSADLRVIPNGINSIDEFNPAIYNRTEMRQTLGLQAGDTAIFYVGRLSEEKNPDVFVNVAKNVIENKKHGKNAKFFIIGDGKMQGEILDLIAEVGSSQIQYLGYQSKIAQHLSAADVFILPSSIEGFPLSILEAMAMKVVVIASKVGAVPDVIESGRNGFIVTPGSVKEIYQIVERLLSNNKLLVSVKKESRDTVDAKYSNILLGKNYRKLYGEK
jgi:glycosyltransferase involved in cell wall biosynthesis/2-polyprenyl-3-methyl-5-hydroxy-6-metoxy-1,4-benzoquinol methylase